MSEAIISPGVFTTETDRSFIEPAPVEAGAAFIGPTVKGPVLIPTVVTSYSNFKNIFGDVLSFENSFGKESREEFLTSMAVRSYFNQGGTSALITRVVNGTYSSATSEKVLAEDDGEYPDPVFTLKTISQGAIMNSSSSLNTDGRLLSGSTENVRWEIANKEEDTGTFDLFIRRGDDETNNKVILESFVGASLDPRSDNYIARLVGNTVRELNIAETPDIYVTEKGEYRNRSRYVYVDQVNYTTADYDSSNDSHKTVLPKNQSGSFENATGEVPVTAQFYNTFTNNTQGLNPSADYGIAALVLANQDEYQFNILCTPGLVLETHTATVNRFVQLAQDRTDCIYVLDLVDYGKKVVDATAQAANVNSSYTSTYWPFVRMSTVAGANKYVPASVVIPGVYAFTDNIAAPWFAPAGLVRGGIPGVIQTEKKLTKANRDALYKANVNPIATFPGSGISVFGQKTLQKRPSALDRVNVRRLLIELKKFFSDQARNLVFEQNTIATRNRFLSIVNPYLESVVQRQGLFAYRVIMDETNNTADVIDRNMLMGQVLIQPSRTAEFVVLDFTIESTGATFNV